MAPDDPAGTRPGPVVLRIKLRYDDVEALIERFASHVGRSGLFLPTRSVQPIGTEVKFELRLATDQAVLVGLGRVKSVREPDPERPRATHGIGVELMRVTREGRELILKLLARRKQLGFPEIGLPRAEDVDEARRIEAEAGEAAVPREAGVAPSGPVAVASGAPVAAATVAPSGPVASAFTAPRRTTGPVTIPKAVAIEPLPAEAPRRRRRLVSEVIESASGPITAGAKSAGFPGIDDEVDVGRVLARARSFATGDLDQELELLRDQQAAPRLEITIEAASAELARQLGGAAVRKDKSQRWAPPPSVTTEAEAEPAEAVVAPAEAKHEEPAVEEPAAEEPAAEEPAAEEPAVADELDEGIIERDEEDLAHLRFGDEQPRAFAPVSLDPIIPEPRRAPEPAERWDGDHADAAAAYVDPHPAADEHVVDDGQIADEIHQLGEADDDDDELEHTHIGAGLIDPHTLDEPLAAPDPVEHAVLSAQLDPQLADDLGFGAEADAVNRDRALSVGGAYDSAIVEELVDAAPTYDPSYAHAHGGQRAMPLPDEPTVAAPLDAVLAVLPDEEPDEEPGEEIDDFEIIAEADAEDADLLAVDGEAEHAASGVFALPVAEVGTGAPAPQRGVTDFAARLDLGDDSDLYPRTPEPGFYERGASDPRELSAGHALAALDEEYAPRRARAPSAPSSGVPRSPYERDGDEPAPERGGSGPHAGSSPLHEFDQSDVIAIPPELRRDHKSRAAAARATAAPVVLRSATSMAASAARARAGGADDYDLETALEALDVDLDDLSIPIAPPEPHREAPKPARGAGRPLRTSAPTPSGRAPRPQSDDGVLIDFDDDD